MKKLYYTKEERICTKCNILKPFSEFNWDKRYNIPFSRCKTCFNERCKKYRHSKIGKQTYEKWVNSTKGKSVRRNAYFKWKNTNPDHRKAGYYLKNAIRDGRVIRKPCEVCGNVKSEGHHTSYKREDWLKVIWLCKKHHVLVHFKMKRI